MVVLGEEAVAALKNYREMGRPVLARPPDTDALFLNRSGGRLTTRSVGRMLHKYIMLTCARRGISPHKLRHTFATHLLTTAPTSAPCRSCWGILRCPPRKPTRMSPPGVCARCTSRRIHALN